MRKKYFNRLMRKKEKMKPQGQETQSAETIRTAAADFADTRGYNPSHAKIQSFDTAGGFQQSLRPNGCRQIDTGSAASAYFGEKPARADRRDRRPDSRNCCHA